MLLQNRKRTYLGSGVLKHHEPLSEHQYYTLLSKITGPTEAPQVKAWRCFALRVPFKSCGLLAGDQTLPSPCGELGETNT